MYVEQNLFTTNFVLSSWLEQVTSKDNSDQVEPERCYSVIMSWLSYKLNPSQARASRFMKQLKFTHTCGICLIKTSTFYMTMTVRLRSIREKLTANFEVALSWLIINGRVIHRIRIVVAIIDAHLKYISKMKSSVISWQYKAQVDFNSWMLH